MWCGVVRCGVPKAPLPEGKGRDVYPRVQINGRAVCAAWALCASVFHAAEGGNREETWRPLGHGCLPRSFRRTPSRSACWCRRSSYNTHAIVLCGPSRALSSVAQGGGGRKKIPDTGLQRYFRGEGPGPPPPAKIFSLHIYQKFSLNEAVSRWMCGSSLKICDSKVDE